MSLSVGTLLGRYEVRSLLGAGGMGEVYLAQDTTLRRPAAIKILPAGVAPDTERLRRFEREAYAASSLNHPNILTIYEIGAENGLHFIATEFVDGESLRQHMNSARSELRKVLDIGIQVASALAAAHAAGIVHRDIKPANVMLRRDGIVKVVDFGLTKLVERERSASDAEAPTRALTDTAPGRWMGTVTHMSPEQVRGLQIDARTDIWSLGVVLYEMLTGRLPFTCETASDCVAAILKTEPPALSRYAPAVPAELERIVTKALCKDREERYQVVKDLALDLKSLKQQLEFKAELERSAAPEISIETQRVAAGEGGAATQTSKLAETSTGHLTDAASDVHTTSSAEYIVNEIKQHRRGAALVLATLLLATAGLAYFFYFAQSAPAGIDSIAVLPFTNTTNDPDTEYLSDGISENLINSLSQLPQLKVIARGSAFKYKGKEIAPQEVAKALSVVAILTGRVAQRGDNLIISAELVDVRDQTQVWGEQFNRQAADLQAVQEEIARHISEKLRLRLTGAQEQQLAKRATPNAQAYQLYLNGLFYSRKGGTENYRKALGYYEQAIALDANFALPYAEMAGVYISLWENSVLAPKEARAKAKAAAQKALELDPMLAEAHVPQGRIKLNEWDWPGAESEFKRAIELNLNSVSARNNYARYLSSMGRHTEALAEIKRAQELDPLRNDLRLNEGIVLYFARRYDESIQQLQNLLQIELGNGNAHLFLGYAYEAKGMYAEAIAAHQESMSILGETTSAQAYLGYAYARSGQRTKALALLNKLQTTDEYVSPYEMATLYAGLGDKEKALAALEQAYAAHDLQMRFLKIDPHFDTAHQAARKIHFLRADPRFIDLMHRVGLTP